jgi:hypothetical protein
VWPENFNAVQVFIDCDTQWRGRADGGVIGLDFSVVLQVASLVAPDDPLTLLRDVKIIAARVAELINEKVAREASKAP